MEDILLNAKDLVIKYFDNKADKGGHPYVGHLNRVSDHIINESIALNGVVTEFYYKAATVGLLHDILEDTDCTIEELKGIGCTQDIIEAIVAITHIKNEPYFDFIHRVSKNDLAKIVKLYDLEDNMNITRLNEFGEYEQKRLIKYWKSWKYLHGDIDELK